MSITPITWVQEEGPGTEDMIGAVENALGIRYPSDFRDILPLIHASEPSRSVFYFNHRRVGRAGSALSIVLSLDPSSEYSVLRTVERLEPGILPPGVVPFGEDGGGDLMAFDFRNNPAAPAVVYVAIGDADEEGSGRNVYPLAPSFTEFLAMLEDRQPYPGEPARTTT